MVDQRAEYWLNAGDIAFALDPETGGDWLQGFHIEGEDIDFLIQQFDRWTNENNLNFADYMFFRKANLAMKDCADEFGMGARNMPCALAITSPGKLLSQQDCIQVYQLASIIENGQGSG